MTTSVVETNILSSALRLRDAATQICSSINVDYIYNPLEYAWSAHKMYLEKYAGWKKKVLFLGMNPGPWGMAQIGVPFGEIHLVKDWVGICAEVGKPENEHPKRPIEGFNCQRSEVSGRRLWGLFKEKFGTADKFFKDHFVANYCPLVFMKDTGANLTPDKLPIDEQKKIYEICDEHLRDLIEILAVEWVIGVGGFAEGRLNDVVGMYDLNVKVGRILHPSPASPAANRDWAGTVTKQLKDLMIW